MYRLDQDANIAGTHRLAGVDVSPAFLVRRFGPPRPSDRFKVSGRYCFADDQTGDVFAVYDYKQTTLYTDGPPDMPTPEEFWADDEPQTLGVGGRGEPGDAPVTAFVKWLQFEQRQWKLQRVIDEINQHP
jgi:hypothetical protein